MIDLLTLKLPLALKMKLSVASILVASVTLFAVPHTAQAGMLSREPTLTEKASTEVKNAFDAAAVAAAEHSDAAADAVRSGVRSARDAATHAQAASLEQLQRAKDTVSEKTSAIFEESFRVAADTVSGAARAAEHSIPPILFSGELSKRWKRLTRTGVQVRQSRPMLALWTVPAPKQPGQLLTPGQDDRLSAQGSGRCCNGCQAHNGG